MAGQSDGPALLLRPELALLAQLAQSSCVDSLRLNEMKLSWEFFAIYSLENVFVINKEKRNFSGVIIYIYIYISIK